MSSEEQVEGRRGPPLSRGWEATGAAPSPQLRGGMAAGGGPRAGPPPAGLLPGAGRGAKGASACRRGAEAAGPAAGPAPGERCGAAAGLMASARSGAPLEEGTGSLSAVNK